MPRSLRDKADSCAEKYILRFTEQGTIKALSIEFIQDKRKYAPRKRYSESTMPGVSVPTLPCPERRKTSRRCGHGLNQRNFINVAVSLMEKQNCLKRRRQSNLSYRRPFQHIPQKIDPDEAVNPTQAETVSINVAEFTSKRSGDPTEAFSQMRLSKP